MSDSDANESSTSDWFQHWIELVATILGAADSLGPTYILRSKPGPEPDSGIVHDADQLLRFLDLSGRTWHRQEFIKARLAVGDSELGDWWIGRLQPWIYRRFLGWADQAGIRSLKRKLARSVHGAGDNPPVETANPLDELQIAINESERVVRFLQLLNGAELPELRVANTQAAIQHLEHAGCLTMQERTLLSENHSALRETQLHLQLLCKYGKGDQVPELSEHVNGVARRRESFRPVIEHLMQEVFTDAEDIPVETEMVLDPDFDLTQAAGVFSGYGFSDPERALAKLLSLATESIRFLSDRRGRHFLAGIAPAYLRRSRELRIPI